MRNFWFFAGAVYLSAGMAHASLLGLETEPYPAIVDNVAAIYWDPIDQHLNITGYGRAQLVDDTGVVAEDVYLELNIGIGSDDIAKRIAYLSDFSTFETTGIVTGFASSITEADLDSLEFLIDVDGTSSELLAIITGYFGDESFIEAGENYFNIADELLIVPVRTAPMVVPLPPAGGLLVLAAFMASARFARPARRCPDHLRNVHGGVTNDVS